MAKALRWLAEFVGLPAAVAAALVWLAGDAFQGSARWLLGLDPAVRAGWSCLAEESRQRLFGAEAPDATRFNILVARLDRDPDGAQTLFLRDAFRNQRGFAVHVTCLGVSASDGEVVDRAESAGEAAAQALGVRRGADLVLWGEVGDPRDRIIRVWFTAPHGQRTEFAARGWRVERGLLEAGFHEHCAAMLQSIALAAIDPALARGGEPRVAETLRPLLPRLRELAANPPPGLSAASLAEMQLALADALTLAGRDGRDPASVQEAVRRYRTLLAGPAAADVLHTGMIRRRIGDALVAEAGSGDPAARNAAALAALPEFAAALAAFRGGRAPLQWSLTFHGLVRAFAPPVPEAATRRLVALLDEELPYLQPPEEMFNQGLLLGLKAGLLRSLGAAGDAAALQAAVAASREMLSASAVRQAALPSLWAVLAADLARSLLLLGEAGDEAALHEAVELFDRAEPLLADQSPDDAGTVDPRPDVLAMSWQDMIAYRIAATKRALPDWRWRALAALIGRGDSRAEARLLAEARAALDAAAQAGAEQRAWLQLQLARQVIAGSGWDSLSTLREAAALLEAVTAFAAARPVPADDAEAPELLREAQATLCDTRLRMAMLGDTAAAEPAVAACDASRQPARAGQPGAFRDAVYGLALAFAGRDDPARRARGVAVIEAALAGDARRMTASERDAILLERARLRLEAADAPDLPEDAAAIAAALERIERARTPIRWAWVTMLQARVLARLGAAGDADAAGRALAAFAAAYAALPEGRVPFDRAVNRLYLAEALLLLAPLRGGSGLEEARDALAAALEVLRGIDAPLPRARAEALQARLAVAPR
jgi:hypothetical protein